MELDERKRVILKTVINAYIRTGEPVGSKALAGMEDLHVSSATIRNEMSDLEKLGYLMKPHTSAGRVPSGEGYRYYVMNALHSYRLTQRDTDRLISDVRRAGLHNTVEDSAQKLADFSECAVFAVNPVCTGGAYSFGLMPVGKNTVALLAISGVGSVKTGFIKTENEFDQKMLQGISSVLNTVLSGVALEQINKSRLELLKKAIEENFADASGIADAAAELLEELKSYELTICGGTNPLSYPEFSDIEVAKKYINMLSKKHEIKNVLLSAPAEKEDFSVLIGEENPFFQYPDAGLVRVGCDSKIPVVFGVMGPARMNYARLKAGCSYIVSQLKHRINEEY